MSRTVAVVPHSHWDREWYAPFESYRARLVEMMDGLLDLLEQEPRYGPFHLDGQVAAVDDYLKFRPETEGRIRDLVASGRLAIGPWYVLMDEFCVSAETIVRNLQLGLQRATELGADSAPVGYLPDMFGHAAQMPQILTQAGLAHAVVWRGVPASVTRQAFWWEAPDGSRVRAQWLPVGYAAGAFLPKDAPGLLRRTEAHEREISAWLEPDDAILLMNGGDHQWPQAWLPDLMDAANSAQDYYRFVPTRLADYVATQPTSGLGCQPGELRSGARAPLLMGVLSNRVDVKQAAAQAENALERQAEPLATLWLPPDLWPSRALDEAWLGVIRNSAHDSICACSADEVGRAVRHRYDAATAIAREITGSALAIAGVAPSRAGTVIVNPSAFARGGVVELDLHGTEPPAGCQQLSVQTAAVTEKQGRGGDLAALLGVLAGEGWLGPAGRPVTASISEPAISEPPISEPSISEPPVSEPPISEHSPLVITLRSDPARPADPATAPVMAEAWARAGAGRDDPLTVRVERVASQRVAARVDDVPGWGWAVFAPAPSPHPDVTVRRLGPNIEVDNGLVHVLVHAGDGTFALDGVAGQNLIVEEGDEGDTYNFSPAAGRSAVTEPSRVEVEIVEPGPLRARIRVRRNYPWAGASPVDSTVEMVAGEATVAVTTSLDHDGHDHRIRAVFPLGTRVESTEAECAFATVVRAEAEGGPLEPALATFPSRRFVTAGPLTVTHQGLLEYELIEDGSALALTLLRAVGILSRPAPPARPNVAGPPLPLRDTQIPGPQTFRYALSRHCPDPWRLAETLWTPLLAAPAEGGGRLLDQGSRLRLRGAYVSSLHRRDGAIEVRVFNPGPAPSTVEIPGHSGTLVDLRSRPVGAWTGSFPLGPWAFATARLAAVSLD